jgi:hypothetical protein
MKEHHMSHKVIARLHQKQKLKGLRSFEIREDGIIAASYTNGKQMDEVSLELARIDPNPRRERRRATNMLVGVLIFTVPIIGFIFGAIFGSWETGSRFAFMFLTVLFSIPAVACWRGLVQQSYDVLVFADEYSGSRVVLFNDNPSVEEFGAFVSQLKEEIQKQRSTHSFSRHKSLPDQIRELAVLKQEGHLTDEEFSMAKRNLLDCGKTTTPVGFNS